MGSIFSRRSQQEEIMDYLLCSGEVVDQTLRELDSINALLGGNSATIDGVNQLIKGRQNISVIDLGCGSGKMLLMLANKFQAQGISFVGVDANPNIVAFAKANNAHRLIRYEVSNILSEEFQQQRFGIAVATLFLHHFTSEQLVKIFRALASQCSVGIVVNDLHRHWFAYYSIKILTRIFSRSGMVKFDAPVSVLRGFHRSELIQILEAAGVKNYTIRWKWAFRWQILIRT